MKLTNKTIVEFSAEEIAEILKNTVITKLNAKGTLNIRVEFDIKSVPWDGPGYAPQKLTSATVIVS